MFLSNVARYGVKLADNDTGRVPFCTKGLSLLVFDKLVLYFVSNVVSFISVVITLPTFFALNLQSKFAICKVY